MGEDNKKGSAFKIVLIVLLVLILIGGAAFAGFFIATKNSPKNAENTVITESNVLKDEVFFELDELLVNLADEGKPRYLKIKIALSYQNNENLVKELENKKPKIRDIIANTLRTKKTTDLSPEGIDPLKKELNEKVNQILSQGRIVDVYFSEILVQ
ncbi:flagellar basal body-associated FliL family protein [Clostridium faecium]|uniref:Flagellar protein FliL n=1 Tax=Clostridium faecium TaxID=2762223 RepID=A0ABR8YQA4_9CLOT|nr:flagellar basal body-associated FliL family protein [Clostridium faecium]MBD8046442.1 flagellar basal body-associated FliL family protein [Clostridium faecium]